MSTTLEIIDSLIAKIQGCCELKDNVGKYKFCYKFWTIKEWNERKSCNNHWGSDFDKKDGFIHMCTIDQIEMIATRYFGNKSQYFIVKMDLTKIKKLQFDTNEHGTFPHAYTDIPKEAVVKVFQVKDTNTFDFSSL